MPLNFSSKHARRDKSDRKAAAFFSNRILRLPRQDFAEPKLQVKICDFLSASQLLSKKNLNSSGAGFKTALAAVDLNEGRKLRTDARNPLPCLAWRFLGSLDLPMVSQALSPANHIPIRYRERGHKAGKFLPMNGRLARFVFRVQSAAVALMRDHNAALETLRMVNKELLVTAMAEVPEEIAAKCDAARTIVIEALRLLDPIPAGGSINTEELPPAELRHLISRNPDKFRAITDPAGQS